MAHIIAENIQIIAQIIITGLFVAVPVLFWLEREAFLSVFRGMSKLHVLVLASVIGGFTILVWSAGFSLRTFIPSDQEWEILDQARRWLAGERTFEGLRYGPVYPLLLYYGFAVFGVHPLVASFLNYLISVISIVLVYAISRNLFGNTASALISATVCAFSPYFFVFSSMHMGFPALLICALLLLAFTFTLFLSTQRPGLLVLIFVLAAIISQIKPEYAVVYGSLVMLAVASRKIGVRTIRIISLMAVISVIALIPYFAKNSQLRGGFADGWCGCPSMKCQDGQAVEYHAPWLIDKIDPAIQFFTNSRFSVIFLIYKLPDLVKFWTLPAFLALLPLMLIGIYSGLKKRRWPSVYPILLFCLISCVYLLDCALLDTRYLIPTFGLLVIFSGGGIRESAGIINRERRTLVMLMIVAALFTQWYITDYRTTIFRGYFRDHMSDLGVPDNYKLLSGVMQALPPGENINVYVVHNNEEKILSLMGYNAFALNNLAGKNVMSEMTGDSIFSIDLTGHNYFIYNWYCTSLPSHEKLCGKFMDTYALEERFSKGGYTLHAITGLK